MASEQTTYEDEQIELPNALEDNEIARLMKLVGVSDYKKSEDAPTRQKEAFKPRTLVEIAMEAQQKRDEDEKPAKIEPIKTENLIHKEVIKGQEIETVSDSLNTDSTAPQEATAKTEKPSSNDSDTTSQDNKDTVGIAPTEKLNSSDKLQSPDETSTGREAAQELTVSEDIEIDKNSRMENTQDDFAEQTETETELSKAIQNPAIRYDEGYRAGVEAGKNEMKEALEQKFSEQQNTFEALINSLTRMSFAETKELEKDIQAAILKLASDRVGVAILDMPESFFARIEHLMTRIGKSVDSPVIKLNKEDLVHIERVKEQHDTLSKIRFVEEETLNHGDISISLSGIEIEDILENRINFLPLDSNIQINIEQPNSEAKPEISDLSETINTVTEGDNISNKVAENTNPEFEDTKAVEQEIESDKIDIGDKSTDIDNKEELS